VKRIQTLGGLAVFDGGRPLGGNAQQPRRLAILAVLARAGDRGVNRDRLASLFWGDIEEERARRNLNQALYSLRHDLGSDEAIEGTRDLRLNSALVETDVAAFETARASGALEDAARLYAGPFLGDFHLPGVPEFAQWAEEERAGLAADYRGILEALAASATGRGDRGGAVLWWRRLAGLDPANAQAAQGLMRALAVAGDTPGALRHADIFTQVRQQELELPPDPDVDALAERIRRGNVGAESPADSAEPAADLPAAPESQGQSADTPVGRPSLSRELSAIHAELRRFNASRTSPAERAWGEWLAVGLATLAVITVVGIAIRWRTMARPELRPSVVAVAPFDVLDPGLGLWREGLLDLLSRNLDGAGPLTTVPPTVVLRRWAGRADRESATELGRRTGAELALYGSLLNSGPDSARLRATLLDVARGRTIGEWEVVDAIDRMDRLVDSLTIRLLEGLGLTRPIGAVRLTRFGGTSLPALKAFLQGEQHHRRSEWDSAVASYERAIVLDSGFALALWRASNDLDFTGRGPFDSINSYELRANAHNRGLPRRDSLLIVSDSLFTSVLQAGPIARDADPAWMSRLHRLFATLEHATTLYPDDPEAWVLFGNVHRHLGPYAGRTYQQQLQAYDRAIALDSAFTPAYVHAIEAAAVFGGDVMRRYLHLYRAVTPQHVGEVDGARLIEQLLDSVATGADPTSLFQSASEGALGYAASVLSRLPDSTELALKLARFAAHARPGKSRDDSIFVRRSLLRALLSRGHLREAQEYLIGSEQTVVFAEAALIGAVPPERAAAAFREQLPPASPQVFARFPWFASEGDTASLRGAETRADSLARSDSSLTVRARARYVAASAAAYRTLARRDTAAALKQILALPDSACPGCYLDRLTLAELLVKRGRDREAWRLLQGEHPGSTFFRYPTEVPWALLQGRVAERLGRRDRAIQSYTWVVGMWRNADPELQPYVREARDGLTRLTAEPQ
jgi:serine/threonine-protein kinase